MTGSDVRFVRMLRAAVASLVVIALGTSAHTAGGGTGPPPLAVAVLFVVVAPLVWALVRARTSAVRMALAVAAGQLASHLALVAMAPGHGSAVRVHTHGDAVLSGLGGSSGGEVAAALHLTPAMLGAHLVATVLAAVVLSYGEDAVSAAVRLLLPTPRVTVTDGLRRTMPLSRPAALTGRSVRPLGGRAPPLPVS